MSGHIRESCAEIQPHLILVLLHRPGETNLEARHPPLFDECGFAKVSFPAHLSVK
jgi:hypothetical protein